MKEAIEQILCYIREHVDDIESVNQLATTFGYSKYYFSREFKRLTGFTAMQFISSLKMEKSIGYMVEGKSSILSAQLQAGFLSSTTFSANFEKQTGITPKQYQKQLNSLYHVLKEYESYAMVSRSHYATQPNEMCVSRCFVMLNFPKDYTPGITFVGLFKQPIPNHVPVVAKAIVGYHACVFDNIPQGTYWLLACTIEKQAPLHHYFVLKDCLRAKEEQPLIFPQHNGYMATLNFRGPLPQDPPITINLPKLLAEGLKKKGNV